MLSYKLDPATTPQAFSELASRLSKLASEVKYNPNTGELTLTGYGKGQRAIEDLVMPYLPVVNDAPDWGKLASLSAKRKLQIAR